MKMRWLVVGIIVIAVLVGGGYFVLGQIGTGNAAQKSSSQSDSVLPAVKSGTKIAVDSKVVPVKSAELSLPTGGTVAEVPVAEGDRVEAGQLLVRLDAKQQTAAVAQAEATVSRSKATLARGNATLAQLKAGPRDEDIAAARAAVHIAEAELARLQKGPDQSQLITAETNLGKAGRALQQAQFLYDQIKGLSDVTARPESVKLEQATLDYEAAKAQYDQLKAGPTQADLNVAQARLEQAQAALAQVQAGPRPEAIAAAEADVAAAEADVATAQAGLTKAQLALSDTELKAPFAGTVLTLNAKPGELVSPANFVVLLADVSAWQIETQDLTELSIVGLHQGDPVNVTFDAIPDLKLSGAISRIGEFGKNKQGDIVYTVLVTPDHQDERLRWNMTASVVIEPK